MGTPFTLTFCTGIVLSTALLEVFVVFIFVLVVTLDALELFRDTTGMAGATCEGVV